MSSGTTRFAAMACCYYMRKAGHQPGTIINVGVGSAPELFVWKWLLPDVPRVGIDPRGLSASDWTEFVQFAAGEKAGEPTVYCNVCRSTACKAEGHKRSPSVATITVDEVAAKYPAPYFLWIDCEGSELAALRGAHRTLSKTNWLNIEVRNFDWVGGELAAGELHNWLAAANFKFHHQQLGCDDRIYRRRGPYRRQP